MAIEGEIRSHEYQREVAVGTQRTAIPLRVWEIRVYSVLKLDRAAKRESNDDSLEEVPRWGASPNHDRLKSTPRSFLEWGLAKGKVVDDHLA